MEAVQEEEVRNYTGVGFMKEVCFKSGVKERGSWMSRVVNQKMKK